jgi:Helix-turn-helix domain
MARQQPLAKLKEHLTSQATPGGETAGASEQQHRGQQAEPESTTPTQGAGCPLTAERLDRIENTAVETLTNVLALVANDKERLARIEHIEQKLAKFVAVVTDSGDQDRTHYTPAEFAEKAVNDGVRKHLDVRTVRRWCRENRLKAEHRPCGRGKHGEYMIPHAELVRYKNEGLLPRPKD